MITAEDKQWFLNKQKIALDRYNNHVKLGNIERAESAHRNLMRITKQIKILDDLCVVYMLARTYSSLKRYTKTIEKIMIEDAMRDFLSVQGNEQDNL